MAIRIDFSNIPYNLSAECQRYIMSMISQDHLKKPFFDLLFCPKGLERQGSIEAFILLIQKQDDGNLQIAAITMFFVGDSPMNIFALATNVFGDDPSLSFNYGKSNMPLSEIFEWFESTVVDNLRVYGRNQEAFPNYTTEIALNEIMINWKQRFFGVKSLA